MEISPSPTAMDAGAGSMRVFLGDDDGDSYFDLDMASAAADFHFHVSASPLPHSKTTLRDLFRDGPLFSIPLPTAPSDHQEPPATPPSPPQNLPQAAGPSTGRGSPAGCFGLHGGRRSESGRSHDEAVATAPVEERSHPPALPPATVVEATTVSSRVLKFLVKFPTEKIRKVFVTLAATRSRTRRKPPSLPNVRLQPQGNHGSTSHRPPKRPLYRSFLELFATKKPRCRSRDERRRVVDIGSDHPDFMKSIADAMRNDGKGKGGTHNWQRPVSVPNSLQSSPRHSVGEDDKGRKRRKKVVEREASITSAVAYCKGQS